MLGRAALFLGAGRAKAVDAIDFAVGLSELRKIGEQIERHEPLLKVHARTEKDLAAVLPLIEEAIQLE